jgi:hypothetical protein
LPIPLVLVSGVETTNDRNPQLTVGGFFIVFFFRIFKLKDKIMYQDKPKDTIIKKLVINESYKDFPEFYRKNKEEIYKNIVLSFKSINRKDKQNVVLYLHAKINGLQWETNLKFNKKECFVLVRDILPFFEEKEEYEYCGVIVNLYNKLNSNLQLEE